MIDHVLGRPSVQFRKIQVLGVLSFWSFYLFRGHKHGPPTIRKLSRKLSGFITPWQTLVITLLYLYLARNLGKLLGLECPEPLANLYTRSYFRATWVTTAMDAGFWSAMRIKKNWLRDLCSIVFTGYYLIAAEQADEKVRKVRAMLTVEHLRVSWNKGTTPYLKALQDLMRPRLMKYPPRQIRIPRPSNSDYNEPVNAWLYFDGPLSALKNHEKIVLDIPGGGFVAMGPRTSDDRLFAWAGKTGLPVLSLDYRKAPEFPYPYALNECFDVYCTILASKGRCIGLSGDTVPKVVMSGDSAGGNLATSTMLMIIESGTMATRNLQGQQALPIPDGLILIYPGLDMNIGNWMSDEQMTLIRDRKSRKTNRNIIKRKSMHYTMAAGTPHQSEDEETTPLSKESKSPSGESSVSRPTSISLPSPQYSTAGPALMSPNIPKSHDREQSHHPEPLRTRLAMSSMISYFNDRILSPEMMRAMIILYIGPHNRPDFSTEYLLSPILAPDALLAEFPKTYFLTGERDPLVDDTVIFAGRLRRAKAAKHARDQALDSGLRKEFDEADVVEVVLIPGISHGFLQFVSCFPEGWKYIFRCARWIEHIFAASDEAAKTGAITPAHRKSYHHHRSRTESSGDEDMGLEMSMTSRTKGKEKQRKEDERRKKGKLLMDQLRETGEKRKDRKGLGERKKSMVSLASSDDLLGRRMLGLAGPLTRTGGDDE